jgi:phage tail-like protein
VRGMLADLDSALPLALQLPAVYQEDEFTRRLVSAFDPGFAPVIATLDDLAAYLDPWLTPDDFVALLARWVGAELEYATTVETRRELVATAVALHRRRGTAGGIAAAVRIATGGRVEVFDSGGAQWAPAPGAPLPGDAAAAIRVRVAVADPAAIDLRRLDALVAAVSPGHVRHTVEVVAT